jgi:alkanesulfonate monooxygenase SsuD/methylene tetrahydromethanopterin reductase-like flavin-dependent oxidoreductase (luciferase family)
MGKNDINATATGVGHIRSLAFLTPGNFADDNPYDGLEATLQLFEDADKAGWDGGWIRQRHLEHGVGSAAVFLAAAGQRTEHIELGTAVIPIGYESPFRLAEDLSLADVLSRGRLQVGFSSSMPHAEILGDLVYDGDWRSFDLKHGRIARLVDNLRGNFLGDSGTVIRSPGNVQRPRLQPYAAGLADRIWYGAGSASSARWAGEQGLNLLSGNVIFGDGATDFYAAQNAVLDAYTSALPAGRAGRIGVGRVIVPTDSADPKQRERYRAYAASRYERTLKPQRFPGPGGRDGILFPADLIGTTGEILERLTADPVVARVTELRVEVPYEFEKHEYEQILHDVRYNLAPQLGWTPNV